MNNQPTSKPINQDTLPTGESILNAKESAKNWIVIFIVLVVTSLLAAAWPLITTLLQPSGRRGTALQARIPDVTLPFTDITVNGFLAVLLLAVIVIGVVVGAGFGLRFLYVLLTRQVEVVKESKEYQAKASSIEKREAEQLKALRDGRAATPMPPHKLPRWSVVSTSLIILLFTWTLSMILSNSLVQAGASVQFFGLSLNLSTLIVVGLMLIALVLLALWIRPRRLDAIDNTDAGPIPWDTIWIILTGLIVVGIGLGLVVYFNIPG